MRGQLQSLREVIDPCLNSTLDQFVTQLPPQSLKFPTPQWPSLARFPTVLHWALFEQWNAYILTGLYRATWNHPKGVSSFLIWKILLQKNRNNSLLRSLGSLNMPNLHEGQAAVHLHPLISEEVAEVDKEVSLSEDGKQNPYRIHGAMVHVAEVVSWWFWCYYWYWRVSRLAQVCPRHQFPNW